MAKKVGLNMVYSATNIIIEVECWNLMRRCFLNSISIAKNIQEKVTKVPKFWGLGHIT